MISRLDTFIGGWPYDAIRGLLQLYDKAAGLPDTLPCIERRHRIRWQRSLSLQISCRRGFSRELLAEGSAKSRLKPTEQ